MISSNQQFITYIMLPVGGAITRVFYPLIQNKISHDPLATSFLSNSILYNTATYLF